MSAMGSLSIQIFLISLLSFLLHLNPSLTYSLKNCTTGSSGDNVTWVRCTDRDLTVVPNDVPKNATSLNLSSNHIARINSTDLSSLSKLRYLQMGDNWISRVDDGAFAALELLKDLDLSSNRLTNLTGNVFHGLGKLRFLSLNDNKIAHISPRAFAPLSSLESVKLVRNDLFQMTDIGGILQLPKIRVLDLSFNLFESFRIDNVPLPLPLNKSNLRTLWLTGNQLKHFSITRVTFPNLQIIDLSPDASFEWDVPDPTFLRSLNTLSLSYFDTSVEIYRTMLRSVQSVRELSLTGMEHERDIGLVAIACQSPNVSSLDLSNDDLSTIDETFLRSCSRLTKLNLSGNLLEEMSEFALRSIKQLKSLDVSKNKLRAVPLAIRGKSTLENLDLSSNYIGKLGCTDFDNLSGLRTLNLNHNRIAILNGCVFLDMPDLKVLNIGGNQVWLLLDFFRVNLHKLEVLDLRGNYLRELKPGDFRFLRSLKSLDLESDKDYFAAEDAFQGLDNLRTLSVSAALYQRMNFTGLTHLENLKLRLTAISKNQRSNLTDVPHFSELHSLKSFLIIRNQNAYFKITPDLLKGVESLEILKSEKFFTETPHPDTFTHTPRLRSLQIHQSDLQDLNPELFWPIPNLESLDLSDSKLKSLEFLSQAGLSALRRLTLRQNEITVISETVFQSLPALTHLDLAENPFTCDCSNAGFIQWVKSNNQTQVVNAYQYACSFPAAQQGSKLLDFDFQSCWMDVSFLCFISSSGVVVLTLLASFIYHFLRWQLAYAYHLFLAFLYDSRKRKKGAALHYDAFISYNVHDEAWVLREMLPVLEGEQGWRLCLHHRDFQPGKPIIENITDAIYGSRKTICVISRRYLQSEWCSREIQMASFRLFDEQKDVLILLFLEEIPAYQMSPYYRMRKLVKRRTYLSWPQAGPHTGLFWQKVQRALETGEAPTDNTDPLTGQAGC